MIQILHIISPDCDALYMIAVEERFGEGYSIRSISSGRYLTSEECACDGAAVVANEFPVSWKLSSALDSSDIQCDIFTHLVWLK